ncbi:MAG: FG-GAP-like repeat-containing protein [Limisphaerales bacterium]
MKTNQPAPRPTPSGAKPTIRLILLLALLATAGLARAEIVPSTTLPGDATTSLGGSASFQAAATTDDPPLSRQWQHNGTNLNVPDSVWLRLTNVTELDAGEYRAIISDAVGNTATSRVATLTVDPTFAKITGQPIADDKEATVLGLWCDYDGDGQVDLFVGNSRNALPHSRNTLYHNEGDGSFTRITNALTTTPQNTWGCAWGDYDNDGRPDLFMVPWGGTAPQLFHNDGINGFSQISAPLFPANQGTIDGAWGDMDGDGWLDLVFATWGGNKDLAFRNLGDGTFARLTTNEVGAVVARGATTGSPSFADFDNDGDADLYVPAEADLTFLFRNGGRGFYERVQLGSLSTAASTVGGVWADVNNDGFFDLLTSARSGSLRLHLNEGGQSFRDATSSSGLSTPSGDAWGPAWGDVDNDGDLDLFIPYYSSTNLMFLNNGDGTFASIDVGSPLREGVHDQCAVWVDYDNDGFLDLFVPCGEALPWPNLLYRNNLPATGNSNRWLKVQTKGTASNTMGIGAKIRSRAVIQGREVWQLRQIASNGAFASGAELTAHFGLGNATNVTTLRIEWPSGAVQDLANVAPNQILTVWEPPALKAVVQPDGACALNIRAQPNRAWQIQASNDLLSWQTLDTVTPTTMSFTFTDTAAIGMDCRFYRVISPE